MLVLNADTDLYYSDRTAFNTVLGSPLFGHWHPIYFIVIFVIINHPHIIMNVFNILFIGITFKLCLVYVW